MDSSFIAGLDTADLRQGKVLQVRLPLQFDSFRR
jgi:hypothetical protein